MDQNFQYKYRLKSKFKPKPTIFICYKNNYLLCVRTHHTPERGREPVYEYKNSIAPPVVYGIFFIPIFKFILQETFFVQQSECPTKILTSKRPLELTD